MQHVFKHKRKRGLKSRPTCVRTTREAPRGEMLECRTLLAGIMVNTEFDTVDADPTITSLREAIAQASAGDTIDFDGSMIGKTIVLGSQLTINKNLTIEGPGADQLAISGNNAARVFYITSGVTASLNALTITAGHQSLGNGAGVYNEGTLTLNRCAVTGNHIDQGNQSQGLGYGGGIYSRGAMVIRQSTVSDNTAAQGGGISSYAPVPLTITDSVIAGNSATQPGANQYGGGMSVAGTITIRSSTISDNACLRLGGGIFVIESYSRISIINSTVSDNSAADAGGGIFSWYVPSTIINSTFSGNFAGVHSGGIGMSGSGTIVNCTITGNTAVSHGGGVKTWAYATTMTNTTITGNSAPTGGGLCLDTTTMANNTIISGNAPSDVGSTIGRILTGSNNLIGGDPMLGALADNGGPTQTMALLPGSPAIDMGSNALLPADAYDLDGDGNLTEQLPVDQRGSGYPRVFNGTVDIGAFELTNSAPLADANGPYTIDEGSALVLDGTGSSDPDGDALSYQWDVNGDGTTDATGATPTLTWAQLGALGITDDGTFAVTLTVSDPQGANDDAQTTISVMNVAPIVCVTSPSAGFVAALGQPVSFSGTFNDAGTADTHTAAWVVDGGSFGVAPVTFTGTLSETNGSGTAGGTYTFSQPGIYRITLTVTDDDGGAASSNLVGGLEATVVVYDPSAGFVTGGGWINSPAGAYTADPTLTGKATFGFVSKYKKGASVPTGQTQFVFAAAGLDFHSDSYDFMVVAGAKAQFRGTGTLNGVAGHRFAVTLIDGQRPGGGGVDKFRIQIWAPGGGLVYDNQLGAPNTDDPTTLLGGGSIVIHD